jgi:hypothetical protein
MIFDNLSYLKVWIIIIILPFLAILPDISLRIIQTIVYPTPSDILMHNSNAAKKEIKERVIVKMPTVRRIETIRRVVPDAEVKIQTSNRELNEANNKPDYSQLSDTLRPMINSPEKLSDSKINEFNYNLNDNTNKDEDSRDDNNILNHSLHIKDRPLIEEVSAVGGNIYLIRPI